MKKLFVHLVTEANCRTFDLGRVLWGLACVSYVMFAVYTIYKGAAFDLGAYGTGLAAILGTGGASLAMKAGYEAPAEGDATPPP